MKSKTGGSMGKGKKVRGKEKPMGSICAKERGKDSLWRQKIQRKWTISNTEESEVC